MARYAEKTSVPVARSRGEIDALLRKWGCDGIRWTDVFSEGLVALEFLWAHEGQKYLARFSIRLPSDDDLRRDARKNQWSDEVWPGKLEKLQNDRGKTEHRILLLWLKAALNAVDSGIVSADTIFLPFLVGTDGRTVAEAALPRLPMLLADGAKELLALPSGT